MRYLNHVGFVLLALSCLTLPRLVNAQTSSEQPKERKEELAKPAKILKGDSELTQLLKQRYNVALKVLEARFQQYQQGRITIDGVLEQQKKFLLSKLALDKTLEAQIKTRERLVKFAGDLEKIAKARFDAGRLHLSDYLEAQYEVLNAKIALARAKEKLKAKKK